MKRLFFYQALVIVIFSVWVSACASLDPRDVDVELKPVPAALKITSFDPALSDLGLMTLIYGCDILNIMADDGSDHTGTSQSTGGEIPRDMLEMMKTSLNAIGGNVYFIPNNSHFMERMMVLGMTDYANKRIPHVVITGAITEFDRGLSTRGKNIDLGTETQPFSHAPKWTPGDTIGLDYGQAKKSSLARISLDFNLIDFEANVGIPKMQTVNTVLVHKAVREKELAVSFFGPSLGLKGTIKKVEGRHAAVRLLVQLGIIQVIGKYFDLPYWNLLSHAKPDPVVIDIVGSDFAQMDDLMRAVKTQEMLYLHGYNIPVTGRFDQMTRAALKNFDKNYEPGPSGIDLQTYMKLYCSVPINKATLQRRYQFTRLLEQFIVSLTPPEPPPQRRQLPKSKKTKPSQQSHKPSREKEKKAEKEIIASADAKESVEKNSKANVHAEADAIVVNRLIHLLEQKRSLAPKTD